MDSRSRRDASDTLLVGGIVRRSAGDPAPSDAVWIREGRVVAIGRADQLRAAVPVGTRIQDLAGRTVMPAFVDSHTHFHRGAVLRSLYLDFDALRPSSVADVLASVRDRATAISSASWIQGDNLSALRLDEGRLPNRHELDLAAPGRPVVLRGIGKHVVAASSVALAAAGIDAGTADPPGGRIERDADGQPTGILHERAKLRLDQSHPDSAIPRPSVAERRRALLDGFAALHRVGVTTIHEMVRLPEEAGDLAALHASGELGVRVRLYYRVHESRLSLDWLEALGIRSGLGDDWLRVLGVKVSVDGFCIFRNAAVYEPYQDEPENTGLLRIEAGQLDDLVRRANAQGLQIAIHAVGARAVDMALDAFAAAGPAVSGPHRLEHAYLDTQDAQLVRMQSLGLAWSTQPAFFAAYAREWLEIFGPDRRDRMMPLARGRELGIPILLNSDYPCAAIDPLEGIREAVAHVSPGTGTDEAAALDLVTAWDGFTSTPARIAGDSTIGRIREGSWADLVVFDRDPFAADTELPTLSVRATMMAGKFVAGEEEVVG